MATAGERASAGLLAGFAAAVSLILPLSGLGPAADGRGRVGRAAADMPRPPAGVPGTGRLRLPDLPLPAVAAQASGPATHTIAAGDTLWDVARSAGVSVAALAAANGVSERSILRLGRVLRIPARGTVPALTAARAAGPGAHAGAPEGAGVTAAAPAAVTRTSPAPAARRLALRWPSAGIITSRFGWRISPIFGRREFHTGMDIATRYGSPVVAARSGIVRFVGWMSGYGRLVVLDHGGGIETSYSHLSAALVNPGERVAAGQVIGRIGNTGWSTGPHLFFEVRRNGVPVDPARYLN